MPESIILIITKVEDPEELDTRFSKFAPFKGNKPSDTVEIDGADNIIDIFRSSVNPSLRIFHRNRKKKGRKLPPLRQQKLRMHHSSRLRVL